MPEHDPARLAVEDAPALARFLAARGISRRPLVVAPVGEGHSSVTYLVEDATGSRWIVRRPPEGADGTHDVLREARFLDAVSRAGFPAPAVLATAGPGEALEVPCFVMHYVPGIVLTTDIAPLDESARARAGESMIETLAALHALEPAELGLRGRPHGANARQRDRYARLIADTEGRPPRAFAALDAWLDAHLPAESGAAVVHGDYRVGNVLLDPTTGAVVAVLDWELAGVGDPLVDLGYLLACWAEPSGAQTPIEELGAATAAPGFPSRRDLVERYARATGAALERLDWYIAFAYWKLAVLYEHQRRLAERGEGDPYYAGPEKVAAFLAAGERAATGR